MNRDASHELLLKWMTLQRAMKRAAIAARVEYSGIDPSQSDDPEVEKIWLELTAPANLDALLGWREAELENEQPTALVDQAIKCCRERGR